MFNRTRKWIKRRSGKPAPRPQAASPPHRSNLFSTDNADLGSRPRRRQVEFKLPRWINPPVGKDGLFETTDNMDDYLEESTIKPLFNGYGNGMSDAQYEWYAAQSFIGWQMCAILMQHWLIAKACSMPGKDAIRNGWEVSLNDGTVADAKLVDLIRQTDKKYLTKDRLVNYISLGRGFGVRHALFVFDIPEAQKDAFYENPFNIDNVKPGSYRGIRMIDPYWLSPLLSSRSTSDPTDMTFYEPDQWNVAGRVIHKSHMCIFTTGDVPDILKMTYNFGGVSVAQKIYERVYAAERMANEGPQLAMTKRSMVMKTDIEAALLDQEKFNQRMRWVEEKRDNYAYRFAGLDDNLEQFDLSLNDLPELTMTEYQLVAAIADVPGTKLLGTQPKGFNSTGDYEEASYHEFLESIQEHDLTPVLDHHYKCVIKSDIEQIAPQIADRRFTIAWNGLDAMTAKDQASVNLIKAQVDEVLIAEGIIDSADARKRIVNDPDSGYNGLSEEPPPMPDPAPVPGGHADAGGAQSVPGQTGQGLPVKPPAPHPSLSPSAGA